MLKTIADDYPKENILDCKLKQKPKTLEEKVLEFQYYNSFELKDVKLNDEDYIDF